MWAGSAGRPRGQDDLLSAHRAWFMGCIGMGGPKYPAHLVWEGSLTLLPRCPRRAGSSRPNGFRPAERIGYATPNSTLGLRGGTVHEWTRPGGAERFDRMRLKQIQVTTFRNVLDSGEVEIQDDITCLVGKNESGKTAVLQALALLNPAVPEKPNLTDYPAWLKKAHTLRGINISEETPIWATFELNRQELSDAPSLEMALRT